MNTKLILKLLNLEKVTFWNSRQQGGGWIISFSSVLQCMTECNVKPLTSVYDWLTINFPLQCHCWTEHSMISSHDNQISPAHMGFSFQVQSLPSFLALVHVVFSNFCELRVVSFFNVCFRKNCNKTFTEFGFCIIKWIIKLHVWLWQIT